MDHQASVNGGQTSRGNGSGGVVSSLSEFGNDVATLAELQWKLAELDLKESTAKALIPVALVAAGGVLLVACLPVGLFGIASLLASALEIHPGWAMLLTAGAFAAAAALVIFVAGRRLGSSFTSFRRSQEELTRNLAWIRTVLVHSGRSAPKRRW